MLAFAPWAPDIAPTDTNAAREARNVFPTASGYGPMPGLQAYSSQALAARAVGFAIGRTTAAGWGIYAGTTTKLYHYTSGAWDDATRTSGGDYALSSVDLWSFAQFGDNLYACAPATALQSIGITAGTNFAAASGSPPNARTVAVVGDFLVLACLDSDPKAIQWSDINDPTNWSTGLSDSQSFPDGGDVTGVAGGEVGYVLQEYAIRRMRFLPGSDYVFTFERVVDGTGCVAPYGFATVGGVLYFVSEDGFYSFAGQGLTPLGANRVNKWFIDNSDLDRISLVQCVADPVKPRIFWAAYSSAGSSVYDLLVVYDWQLDRFSYGIVSADVWGVLASPGTTLDDISASIDGLTYSLDSRTLSGGRPTIGAINTSHQLATLSGLNLEAIIETQEGNIVPGKRSFVNAVMPLVDVDSATVRVGSRERVQDAVSYSLPASLEVDGWCKPRASGRLHRAEVTIPAAVTWTHAQGIDISATTDGER
jgi:hypothetical protein